MNELNKLNNVSKVFGMKINVKKIIVMCISCNGNNNLKNPNSQSTCWQVSQFRYLGSLISVNGYCIKDIQSRIEMSKKVLLDKNKMLLVNWIWYWRKESAEMWMLMQADRQRLEAYEMWIFRRIERISWKDKVTNENVCRKEKEEK